MPWLPVTILKSIHN